MDLKALPALPALQERLRQFAAERDWQPFHTPKNLAMALMVEAAELAEIYQWMTPEQSQVAHGDRVLQAQIADEAADVLLYLVQLADHAALDLNRAVERKLLKNAKKHPPLRPGLPAGTSAGVEAQTHVLVDWENVQPKDADLRALVPDVTDVWIFHGPNQKRVGLHHASFGERLTLVPIARTGKNALDFHLSFYMGYIASRHPDARFVVVSNDNGYAPMLAHAMDLGFAARPMGFDNSKKVLAKKRLPTRKLASPAVGDADDVPKKATRTKPRRPAESPAENAVLAPAPLPKLRRPRKAAVVAAAARAPLLVHSTLPASPPLTDVVAPRKTRRGRQAAATVTAPSPGVLSETPAITPAAPRPPPAHPRRRKDGPMDLARSVQHVHAGLRKTANKPTRRPRLSATIQSLLGASADEAMVQAVLRRLLADGTVAVDAKGAVSYAL